MALACSSCRRALPIAKALRPDTLLACALSGEVLPKDHGYPLRALIFGRMGSASVLWPSRIIVSTGRFRTRCITSFNAGYGPSGVPQERIRYHKAR